MAKAKGARMLEMVPDRDKARLLEQRTGVGTGWMTAIPNPSLHTIILPEDYTLGLRWWLGLPVLPSGNTAPRSCPGCAKPIDVMGDHLLCCARNNYALRHTAVQEALSETLTQSGQLFRREVPLRAGHPADLRPADLLLEGWSDGIPCAVDLTISHGWGVATRGPPTMDNWRPFLRRREEAKHAKYDAPCRNSGWAFAAMAFGTWGGMGPEGARLLSRIHKRACAAVDPAEREVRGRELHQMLSLALMRQVWRLLSGRNHVC